MENVSIKCSDSEMIAIRAAFFTTSVVDQCPFANNYDNGSSPEDPNAIDTGRVRVLKRSCTDDLRMTLNSKSVSFLCGNIQ